MDTYRHVVIYTYLEVSSSHLLVSGLLLNYCFLFSLRHLENPFTICMDNYALPSVGLV